MNNPNLDQQSFKQATKYSQASPNLAKCTNMLTIQGNNYFIYRCPNGHQQIKAE